MYATNQSNSKLRAKVEKNFSRNKNFPGEKQPRKNKDITLRLRKIMPVQKEGNRVNKK